MRKLTGVLLALLMILSTAQAGETFDGTVITGETLTVTAPYGATVDSVLVRKGQRLTAGQELLVVETTRVVAPEDGTVRGLFVQAGDSAAGTAMSLAPVSRYTVRASITKAEKTAANRYVTMGESVYLRCSKDGTHRARGVITGVDGTSYTVQTTAGELYMEETVYVYRSADYDDGSCIGSGTVSRTEAVSIGGEGSILRLHVADGETVERGQLLMETVDGVIDEQVLQDSAVRTPVGGIVTEIKVQAGQKMSQGGVLLTLTQPENFQIRFSISEEMLSEVKPGMTAAIHFNWNEDKSEPFAGTVTEVSYIAETQEGDGDVTYSGYISFTADETVREGMNVTVVLD